ncbi:MAG TPA: hypothetical protein VFC29_03725 [Candidatus Limnocylindrales bacterium]|jgi:metal-responsive CopG/Arc/MetJ family transcriptional regulator|nr:hypothetical protein [Candidatus Limnocylindrales bacterium]
MKRATVTLPDDLADAVESYARNQEARPALTAVVQSALRQFLTQRGYLGRRRSLRITPAKHGSGLTDVSQEHDRYFAESVPKSGAHK